MRKLPRSRLFYIAAASVYALVTFSVVELVWHAEEVFAGDLVDRSVVDVLADIPTEHLLSFFIYLTFALVAAVAAYRVAASVTTALAVEERRASELQLVSGLASRLAAQRDPAAIGKTAALAVREVVPPGTTVGFIAFTEAEGTFRIAAEEGPRDGEFSGRPYALDVLPEPLRQQVLKDRTPVFVADTRLAGPMWVGLVSRFPDLATARTFAVVPLTARERLVGALLLRDDRVDALGGGRAALLLVLATTIASALGNALSIAEAEARAEREALLNRIAQRSRESLDPSEVLRRAVEDLGRAMGVTRSFVALGTTPDDLRVAAEWVADGVRPMGRGSQHVPAPRLAARESRTILIEDVVRDMRLATDTDIRDVLAVGTKSILATPIGMRGQTVGVLTVSQADRQRRWSTDDRVLIESVAHELRVAMEAARLFQARQRENERMLALHHASAVLAGQTDPGVILEEILKNAVRLLGHGSASLFVWVPEAKVLQNVRDYQVRGALRQLRAGEGVAGRAFERMAPVIVNDYQHWEGANETALDAGQRAALAVPLIKQGEPLGAIVIRSYDPAVRFTEEDGHLLTLFADQAVAALAAAEAFAQQHAAVDELDRLSRAKSDFISIVSHEFRTPLTGIMGFSEMMRDEELSTDEIREYAADIHKDAQRLNRMISDMLDLDRLESGRMRLYREAIDLNSIVRDVADRFQPNTPNHTLELHLDDRLPPLLADRDKVTQVLMNLMSNAVKYSPEGGDVTVTTRNDGAVAHVTVRDEGLGIPADALEKIFERYSRIESGKTRHIQGTGLGLPIVRQIVDMHGGRAWAESQVGVGSTFHFTLPLATVPEAV